jgi:hypothetical protein
MNETISFDVKLFFELSKGCIIIMASLLVFHSLSHFSEGALKLKQGKSLGKKNGGLNFVRRIKPCD